MGEQKNNHAETETLRSWKAIANYLKRRVRTAQRWERHEGLPVHRHRHQKQSTVYAYKHELDAWLESRESMTVTVTPPAPTRWWTGALIVALAGIVWGAYSLLTQGGLAPSKAMLVVLPFDNLSADESMQFLSDGLTEELSTQLARVDDGGLSVIARTSAMSYRDRSVPVDVIRDELGVNYLLEGSVRREDGSVRVTAQLIEAETQTHVWASSYDFTEGAWLSLQDRATERIVTAVVDALDLDANVDLDISTRTLEAHEYVLLGHRYMDRIDGTQVPRAIEHFNRAIEIDERSIDAYFGLAVSYGALAFNDAITLREGYGKAREYASRILEFEPDNGDAIAMMGWVKFAYDWDWEGARADLERAVALRPNSQWPHWIYANFLSAMAENDAAVEHARIAHRIDPMAEYTNVALGYILTGAKRYAESATVLEAFGDRNDGRGRGFLINSYDFAAEYQSAIDLLNGWAPKVAARISQAYERDNATGYWAAWRDHYDERLEQNPDFFFWKHAVILAKLGEIERAIDTLERGFHQRSGQMAFIQTYPLEPLHDHPRYQALVRRMNLSPAH